MSSNFECDLDFLPGDLGSVGISKYKSKNSGMTVYFAEVESPVINGYFCLGSDQPEAGGIEQLIHHLDSSGGLLPRPMRGEMLRPAWQFHGAENPLADRDQSCYVCCALGEPAFLGTFSCSTYLLQNIEAVMELHGYPYKQQEMVEKPKGSSEEVAKTPDAKGDDVVDALANLNVDIEGAGAAESATAEGFESDEEEYTGPRLEEAEYYALSEAGEGAMAWEGTLQSMFPNTPAFWNRLLSDGRFNRSSSKMRRCYDRLYRPENLTVIITGIVKNKDHILDVLHDHESDFTEGRPSIPPFVKPWSRCCYLPMVSSPVTNTAWFVCRNPMRKPMPTVCVGWRGCSSTDLETSMSIKVLSAHLAIGPMWTKLVTTGLAHRISWCQLEYSESCSLITVHGLRDLETAENVVNLTNETIDELMSESPDKGLKLDEIRAMADRVGWHYIREFESEPFLMIASAIAKAERYGEGSPEQVKLRMRPRIIFDELLKKPIQFWLDVMKKHFVDAPIFCTKVLPKDVSMDNPQVQETMIKEEQTGDFAASSRRAASRPRRATNPVAQEIAVEDDNRRGEPALPSTEKTTTLGMLEEHLQLSPFPFGDFEDERKEFESGLEVTNDFLENVKTAELKSWPLTSFNSESEIQHPLFPLTELPMYTFLEDTETSFVYITTVLDTSHLNNEMRKFLPSVTAALGAFVCPRPPGLDTDCEIVDPNEFNPPLEIADSQVSIGLNGEMMQSIFLTIIVRPEKYCWAVGLLHYILYKSEFFPNFLKFVATEAARGLAANYKMQTAEKPNYDCFDSTEINLHSLIKQVYEEGANARLFVGRRRLDLMMEYIQELDKNPAEITSTTNDVWKSIVAANKIVVQLAAKVKDVKQIHGDLVQPWKQYFTGVNKPETFSQIQPTLETTVMKIPKGSGIAVSLSQPRLPCLNIAITINPHNEDFPKLCMAAQLFSMAQKWIWNCWDLDDYCSPVLRMPCSYANLMTLNLESYDVIGCLKTMQMLMTDDWKWISAILTATKLMVVNDPATMELGPQGTIASALLSHLAGQPENVRRDLLKDSMNVTVDDIKHVIKTYLLKFFDPKESCCSLLTSDAEEKLRIIQRLEEMGYKMESKELQDLCVNL